MAHYSERLRQETEAEKQKIQKAEEVIVLMRRHLSSSKFFQDTTIQVSDVHNWLDCIVDELRSN